MQEEGELDDLMGFRCDYCKEDEHIENAVFDGRGGRFCSKECMKKGNKSLKDFAWLKKGCFYGNGRKNKKITR